MTPARGAICLILLLACGSEPIGSPSPSTSTPETPNPLLGDWRWTRSCEAVVESFEDVELTGHLSEALVDARYFPSEDAIRANEPCAGAEETGYLYFFEAPGRWGLIDDDDVLVEDREFTIVDDDTIAFDDLEVDHRIDGDTLTFEVRRPTTCDAACVDTYVWAVTTFAPATLRRAA